MVSVNPRRRLVCISVARHISRNSKKSLIFSRQALQAVCGILSPFVTCNREEKNLCQEGRIIDRLRGWASDHAWILSFSTNPRLPLEFNAFTIATLIQNWSRIQFGQKSKGNHKKPKQPEFRHSQRSFYESQGQHLCFSCY